MDKSLFGTVRIVLAATEHPSMRTESRNSLTVINRRIPLSLVGLPPGRNKSGPMSADFPIFRAERISDTENLPLVLLDLAISLAWSSANDNLRSPLCNLHFPTSRTVSQLESLPPSHPSL